MPAWWSDLPWAAIGAAAIAFAAGGAVAALTLRRGARDEGPEPSPPPHARGPERASDRLPTPRNDSDSHPMRPPPSGLAELLRGPEDDGAVSRIAQASILALILVLIVAAVLSVTTMSLPTSFPMFGPAVSSLAGVHALALLDLRRKVEEGGQRPTSLPLAAAGAASVGTPAGAAGSTAAANYDDAAHAAAAVAPAAAVDEPALPEDVQALLDEANAALDAGGDHRTAFLDRLAGHQRDTVAPARARAACAAAAARLLFEAAEAREGQEERKRCLGLAVARAKDAIELDAGYFGGHKWLAIALGSLGAHQGFREKISNALVIRDAARRAIELRTTDPGSHHTLGMWYFSVAGLSWVERGTVRAVFGANLEASYEDALAEFEAARAHSAAPWPANQLMVAKSLAALKRRDEARRAAAQVAEGDGEAASQARQLLSSL